MDTLLDLRRRVAHLRWRRISAWIRANLCVAAARGVLVIVRWGLASGLFTASAAHRGIRQASRINRHGRHAWEAYILERTALAAMMARRLAAPRRRRR